MSSEEAPRGGRRRRVDDEVVDFLIVEGEFFGGDFEGDGFFFAGGEGDPLESAEFLGGALMHAAVGPDGCRAGRLHRRALAGVGDVDVASDFAGVGDCLWMASFRLAYLNCV